MSFAASRWISLGLLMNEDEWRQFFRDFPSLKLFVVASVVDKGQEEMKTQDFLHYIKRYIQEIQETAGIDLSPYRMPFSCALTEKKEDFILQTVSEERCLLKPAHPMIQLRPLSINKGSDGELLMKSWGKNNILWGIQLSYPQIFQDPKTKQIIQALSDHPHGGLFKKILQWFRRHAKPVLLKGNKKPLPFSLKVGKESVYLLSQHQQFRENQIEFIV